MLIDTVLFSARRRLGQSDGFADICKCYRIIFIIFFGAAKEHLTVLSAASNQFTAYFN